MGHSTTAAFIADVNEFASLDLALLDTEAQLIVWEHFAHLMETAKEFELVPALACEIIVAAELLGAQTEPMAVGLLRLANWQTPSVTVGVESQDAAQLDEFA